MEREFFAVTKQIIGELPPELADSLLTQISFWDLKQLSKRDLLFSWINDHIRKNSKDKKSVKIYSILTGLTTVEIQILFQRCGL